MDCNEAHCYAVEEEVTLCLASTSTERVSVEIYEGGSRSLRETVEKEQWPKPSTRRRLAQRLAEGTTASYRSVDDGLQTALTEAMLENDSELLGPSVRGSHVPILALMQLDDRTGPINPVPGVQVLGKDCPTTTTARERLRASIRNAMENQLYQVLEGPTALGKSFIVAVALWTDDPEITGGQPVIQLSKTRDARDEAAQKTRDHGGTYRKIQNRKEACPVAGGDYDEVITVNGQPASEWLDIQCDKKGIDFANAHDRLAVYNDQDRELPCEIEECTCPAKEQWVNIPRDEDGDPVVDVIHATHQFAFVPSFRDNTNLVFDEVPEFALIGPGQTKDNTDADSSDLTREGVRRAITAFLREVGAPVETYEQLVAIGSALSCNDHPAHTETADRLNELHTVLGRRPEFDWYFYHQDAHILAPALAEAVWRAAKSQPDANGRRRGRAEHIPPRPDRHAYDRKACRNWVTVVLDRNDSITTVRNMPDMNEARSVIGLDAYPVWEQWVLNVGDAMTVETVLDRHERQQWRRHERGLWVVQVGNATRPYTSGKYFTSREQVAVKAFLQRLRNHYGDQFRTVITAAAVEDQLGGLLRELGVSKPASMHYGEEKSRNDFGDESIGAVLGSIDPGDDYVIDLLAELGFDASPERSDEECDVCGGTGCSDCLSTGRKRAHGRGFVGPKSGSAAEILASVRENHVAQSVGRYARNADDPDDWALVFVRTDAAPEELIDYQVPGVKVYAEKQRAIMAYLRDHPGSTTREIADGLVAANSDIDTCTKEHVRGTLEKQRDRGNVVTREGVGPEGADVHTWKGDDTRTAVDLVPEAIANSDVQGTHTWELAVQKGSRSDP